MIAASIKLSTAILLAATLGACTAGIPEFRHFDAAYQTQAAAGDDVLDRLGRSERKLWQRVFDTRKVDKATQAKVIPAFDPNEAKYVVPIGDPPLTGGIRDSLHSVTRFNGVMIGLATGEAATALAGRASAAATAATGAVGAFGSAAGLPVAAAFTSAAGVAIAALKPLLEQMAKIEDRARFQELVIEAHPHIKALLLALRGGSTTMFNIHREAYKTRGALGAVEGVVAADMPKLEEERRRLAAWVLLIDQTVLAIDIAVEAIRTGDDVSIASLVDASNELSTLAATLKAIRQQ